jgi:hypothetical protein
MNGLEVVFLFWIGMVWLVVRCCGFFEEER